MILNLTGIDVEGTELPEEGDAQVIAEVLSDASRVDEAVALLEIYGANEILVIDIEEQHFADLQAELPESTLIMGIPE